MRSSRRSNVSGVVLLIALARFPNIVFANNAVLIEGKVDNRCISSGVQSFVHHDSAYDIQNLCLSNREKLDGEGQKDSTCTERIQVPNLKKSIICDVNPAPELIKSKSHWVSSVTKNYLDLLETHELVTKCLTAGAIGILGDALAQNFEFLTQGEHNNHGSATRPTDVLIYDKLRLFGIFFESTFLSGPLMHYAYDYLEYLVPIHPAPIQRQHAKNEEKSMLKTMLANQWGASFFHVTTDLILLGPLYVMSMMMTSALIEGRVETMMHEFKLDFFPTFWASSLSSVAFMPLQMVAFKLLPVQLRLLYMNLQDIIWNAVVSYMAHRSRK